jgi:hypothetical protein
MEGAHTHIFLAVQKRGLLNLPKALLRRHKLDTPGAQVAVVEREDGVIELHPQTAVPSAQAWFWSERWQGMEREADEHLERGEIVVHESADALLEHIAGLRS